MSWTERALAFLDASALPEGGWGYRPGGAASGEATALASLALAAHGRPPAGAAFLAHLQASDGVVGITEELPRPYWPTPLAILVWLADGGYSAQVRRAVSFLLQLQGKTFPNNPYVGQNTELVGWPWIDQTHSWLEPTSYSVMALTRAGQGEHGRVEEGRRVILDRICAGGGWNYGCPAMLGAPSQAFPAPSGVALVALADRIDDPRLVDSIGFLARRTPATRAPISLGWGLLGLAAAGRTPPQAPQWLEESFTRLEQRGSRVAEASLLLLAAQPAAALNLLSTRLDGAR